MSLNLCTLGDQRIVAHNYVFFPIYEMYLNLTTEALMKLVRTYHVTAGLADRL